MLVVNSSLLRTTCYHLEGWCSPHLFQFLYLHIQNSVWYWFKVFVLVAWYYYCKLIQHTENTHMMKENEVFHNRYKSLHDVRLQIPGKSRKSSTVQRLWSQWSLSYSGMQTCFQNSETMGGTETYQAITVTFTVKRILNHTSWRCRADCARRQSWCLSQRKVEWWWSRSRRWINRY